jgi:hypothetical protein
MTFDQVLNDRFPGALLAWDFVATNRQVLGELGFVSENTLAGIGLCRDEICTPFEDMLQQVWGPSFLFSSLAGAVLPGRTAFGAFLHHAPEVDGRHRIACFGFAHVAVDPAGQQGLCRRPGRTAPSNACGALKTILKALTEGRGMPTPDPEGDHEFALLCRRLQAVLAGRTPADLIDLTLAAHAALDADWRALLEQGVDPATTDSALFTGVQVHGPQGLELVWIRTAEATVEGRQVDLL